MNRTLAILSLIFLMPILTWAHGDKLTISFSGIVSESSGKAVQGATISIEHNGQIIQSAESDAEGNFSIKMEGPFTRLDQLKVKVQKKGYRSQNLIPLDCDNKSIEVELHRASPPIPIMRTLGGNSLAI